jgi:low affinity Fe/Cu permease
MMAFGGVMDTNNIIQQIDTEISNLQQARAILIGVSSRKRSPGRPKSTEPKVIKPKKRKLSAKGRSAISAAMKARWAAKRKVANTKVKKAAKGTKS